jgi:hypothetical protein
MIELYDLVSHMTFTPDSRWLAVSTKRGTTHLFAINPYGGKIKRINFYIEKEPTFVSLRCC